VVHAVRGVVIVIVGVKSLERAGEEKTGWMMVDGIERKKLSVTKAKKRVTLVLVEGEEEVT